MSNDLGNGPAVSRSRRGVFETDVLDELSLADCPAVTFSLR